MSNPLVTNTGTHDLWGWGDFDGSALHQRIFGHLVVLATPVVKEYHSDLFHDALWIKETVTGPTSFLFLVRHSGTHLGRSAALMFESVHYDAVLYNIDLSVDERKRWTLTIDLLGAREPRP